MHALAEEAPARALLEEALGEALLEEALEEALLEEALEEALLEKALEEALEEAPALAMAEESLVFLVFVDDYIAIPDAVPEERIGPEFEPPSTKSAASETPSKLRPSVKERRCSDPQSCGS